VYASLALAVLGTMLGIKMNVSAVPATNIQRFIFHLSRLPKMVSRPCPFPQHDSSDCGHHHRYSAGIIASPPLRDADSTASQAQDEPIAIDQSGPKLHTM
jgi:hypothetical protein